MILFLDDERMFIDSYIEALERENYSVQVEVDIDKGIKYFKTNINSIELVILDMMFPLIGKFPDYIDKKKVMGGRRTGEEVLRVLNETREGNKIPKIILTNVSTPDFYDKYATSSEVKGCYSKKNTLPSELVTIVNKLARR